MKKILAIVLCFIIVFSTTCFAVDFSDFNESHWAYNYVTNLVNEGVINGYPNGTFKPEKKITRGEFFKLIMIASQGEEFFELPSLVAENWAEPYINFAANNGLWMDGMETENIDDQITRLEMVIVLGKVVSYKNINKAFSEDGNGVVQKISFTDISNLSEMEQLYINTVAQYGLIKGYTDGTFRPNGYMSRAEVATIIYRFLSIS